MCSAGGFCSFGKTTHASGDMSMPGVLEKVLSAIAYDKEIMAIAATEDHIENAVAFYLHLRSKGYDHVVLITLSERGCINWPQSMPRPPGCVWSSAPMPHGSDGGTHMHTILYHHRSVRPGMLLLLQSPLCRSAAPSQLCLLALAFPTLWLRICPLLCPPLQTLLLCPQISPLLCPPLQAPLLCACGPSWLQRDAGTGRREGLEGGRD